MPGLENAQRGDGSLRKAWNLNLTPYPPSRTSEYKIDSDVADPSLQTLLLKVPGVVNGIAFLRHGSQFEPGAPVLDPT